MVAREAEKRIECLECQGLMGCTWCGEQGKWQHLLSRTVLLGARLFSVLGVRALLDAVVGICLVGMRSSSQEGSEEALGLPFPDLTTSPGSKKASPRKRLEQSPEQEWEAAEGAWGSIQKELEQGGPGGRSVCEWSEEAAAGPRTCRWRSVFGKSFQKQRGPDPGKEAGRDQGGG